MPRFFAIFLTVFFIATSAVPGLAVSGSGDERAEADFSVEMKPSSRFLARKILLFPLDLPGYAMRAVTWPIGAVVEVVEEKDLGKRAFELMSTKDGRFWVYPYLEGAPGPGFGGGFGFVYKDAFHRGWKFAGRYDLRINLNQYARFGVEKKELFNISGHGADFSLDSRWAHDGYNNYYGIGEGSSSSNHATYSSHIVRNRFKLDFELLRHVGVGPRFGLDTVWAKSVAKDGHPGVSDIFPVAELVGLDKTINYLVPGAELWFDNRNDDNFPNSGGRYSAGIWRYQAIDLGGVSYNQYEFNLQHNFTLWHPEIVLTLQNKWKVKQATSGDKVPFELLTVLDYSSPLRGFSGGRFHDRSSVLFNIEYRYPVWNVIYGVLFVDAGKVFRKLDQFDLDNFKFSGGGGFRFHYKKIALFNLDIGYGGEGVKFIFGIQKLL